MDFITLGLTNVLHPDILHPIDNFIANNILPGASTKDTKKKAALLFYSIEPNVMLILGTSDVDISRIRILYRC